MSRREVKFTERAIAEIAREMDWIDGRIKELINKKSSLTSEKIKLEKHLIKLKSEVDKNDYC